MAITDNSYWMEGGDAGVLLIHGLGGTPTEMKNVAKTLNRAGFTVYGMQLAGHCGSEADLTATTWQEWYASVEAAHDRLQARCRNVFAGGLSMGALLALHLAARRPDRVRGLCLYSITLKYDGWSVPKLSFLLPLVLRLPWGKRYSFYETFPYGIKDDRLRAVILRQMQSGDSSGAGLLRTPGVSIREFYRFQRVVRRELHTVRTPAIFLHPSHDDIAKAETNAVYCRDRLAGPTELVLLDNSYHIITVDRQHREVADRTAGFFRNLLEAATVPAQNRCDGRPVWR